MKLPGSFLNESLTPAEYLLQHPWQQLNFFGLEFIWTQASSSLFVLAAAFASIYLGLRLLIDSRGKKLNRFWGIGLILAGLGAVFAGIGYQALAFELNCKDRALCAAHNDFELAYLFLSNLAMNCFLLGTSLAHPSFKHEKAIIGFVLIQSTCYALLLFLGNLYGYLFWNTFESLILVSIPAFGIIVWLHLSAARTNVERSFHLAMLKTWSILLLIGLSHFLYAHFGLSPLLWQNGIWFTENDLLHIGMTLWIWQLHTALKRRS